MTEALRLIALLVFGNLCLVAFVLALEALFPRRLARTRALADEMPGRAFLAGAVNAVFFGAIILILFAIPSDWLGELPRLPAVGLLGLVSIGLSYGLAGVARLVGGRLRPRDGALRQSFWGTLALSLGSTLPVVGWFGLLPYAACLGLGAFLLSFFVRARPEPAPEAGS